MVIDQTVSTTMVGGVDGPTLVTFPGGAVAGSSQVIAVIPLERRWGLVTAETPSHPVDHTWPDHPADLGNITIGTVSYPVIDCVIGAVQDGSEACYLGTDIPARRGEDGWTWFVVHVIPGEAPDVLGAQAELVVDAEHRAGQSAGHMACELVTLAINLAFAGRWRKEVPVDVMGTPDFDKLAITTSRIFPYGSKDAYRLGKSLWKKGFNTDDLAAELPELTRRINDRMAEWVTADIPVWVDTAGPELTAFRTWNCGFENGAITVPCGGSHVTRTAELGRVDVTLELSEDGTG